MAIILDADVLIAGERGVFDLQRWLSARQDMQFELAAITVAELFHGLERASDPHRVKRRAYIDTVLAAFRVVPYTVVTAQIHARLWADLESRGNMIGSHDLIVAATALERGGDVATFNVRHFSAIPGLQIITPALP
jgi:predicted nucleic acid-binding protein